jgi:thiamine pyrophosphate-dependent acetolactate synthase large subunit-like protein
VSRPGGAARFAYCVAAGAAARPRRGVGATRLRDTAATSSLRRPAATGAGYALAARLAHPDRQVVLSLGDGAAGFSLLDLDTLVRVNLLVAVIVGNNG